MLSIGDYAFTWNAALEEGGGEGRSFKVEAKNLVATRHSERDKTFK